MTEKEKTKGGRPKGKPGSSGPEPGPEEAAVSADDSLQAGPPASAKDIPRPSSSLASPLERQVGGLKVSLLTDPENITSLEEVERINTTSGSDVRTPLVTVVYAVLANAEGAMTIADLAAKARKYWNRPFPIGPYSAEEFIYLMIADSDQVRVAGQ
jgi:hypothetical protein